MEGKENMGRLAEKRLQLHIDECNRRINTINEFISNSKDANQEECEKNIAVLINAVNAIEEYKQYKTLEEQGKLLKLPCAVDSEVWYIDKYADLSIEIVRGVVDGYLWYRSCGFALNIVWDKPITGHFGYKRKEMPFSEIGKTVFLTREEAEAALKEMSVGLCEKLN